ncbi:hypothetical protein ACA910_017497 [Epithemia clementina (nom. ined.)]
MMMTGPKVTAAALSLFSTSSSSSSSSSSSTFKVLARMIAEGPGVFVLDGGTGEELLRRGMPDDRATWSAQAVANPKYHNLLKDVHWSFLQAGANAITTNSYGITQHVGFSREQVVQHCQTAARLAREVVDEIKTLSTPPTTTTTANPSPCFVFGSLGPLVESYRPDLILPYEQGVATYTAMIDAMNGNVDAFLAETMSSVEESMQASMAVKTSVPLKPLLVSYTLNGEGQLRSGEEATSALTRLLDFTSQHSIPIMAVLFNCAEPESITKALSSIQAATASDSSSPSLQKRLEEQGIVLGAYANRLAPIAPDWTLAESDEPQPMRSDLDPQQYYDEFVAHWVRHLQVKIVGGCCGITPEHIKFLHERLVLSKNQDGTGT